MPSGNPKSDRVYFDESGNTGQDLLNLQDSVFVLGSCRFNPDDEARLLGHFKRYRGNELKFSKLRTSGIGNRAVIDFLNDPALSRETVAVYLIHKPHMIVTKYCDMVLELSMREYGINFY